MRSCGFIGQYVGWNKLPLNGRVKGKKKRAALADLFVDASGLSFRDPKNKREKNPAHAMIKDEKAKEVSPIPISFHVASL